MIESKLTEALHAAERAHNQVVLQRDKALELLEWAWTIIANAGEGDWSKESPQWREAAERWRDVYHKALPAPATTPTTIGEPVDPGKKEARRTEGTG